MRRLGGWCKAGVTWGGRRVAGRGDSGSRYGSRAGVCGVRSGHRTGERRVGVPTSRRSATLGAVVALNSQSLGADLDSTMGRAGGARGCEAAGVLSGPLDLDTMIDGHGWEALWTAH